MAIFKAVVHSDYAQIPNETAQDTSISFEARGLLTMLLSMPHDWEVHKSWVVSQSPAGKDKVSSIFDELIAAGYIRKEDGQRKFGKFSSDDYFVFPTKTTVAGLPQRSSRSGSTVNGESATTKETVKQKKHRTKETSIPPTGVTAPEGADSVCSLCLGYQWTHGNQCERCNGTGKEPTCNDGLQVVNSELTTELPEINFPAFRVCDKCGNKRCPHAHDKRDDCTGSNELGQVGSFTGYCVHPDRFAEQPPKADKPLNVPFDDFWNLYNKKVGRKKSEAKWKRLSNKDRAVIMEQLPNYIRNTPDVQYRKNPVTYLNNESWNDEIPQTGRNMSYQSGDQDVNNTPQINQPTMFDTELTEERKAKNEEMRSKLADLMEGFKK